MASDADFKARTEKQEEIKSELAAAGVTGNSGSFELGDPNYRDNSLDAYTTFGISYDQTSDTWIYDGKIIHILYDADHNTYCDNSASDGILSEHNFAKEPIGFSSLLSANIAPTVKAFILSAGDNKRLLRIS